MIQGLYHTYICNIVQFSAQACPKENFKVRNGTTKYPGQSQNTVQPGQSVSISCDVDYELFGRSRVTCIAGDKTSDIPFCRRKFTNQNFIIYVFFFNHKSRCANLGSVNAL